MGQTPLSSLPNVLVTTAPDEFHKYGIPFKVDPVAVAAWFKAKQGQLAPGCGEYHHSPQLMQAKEKKEKEKVQVPDAVCLVGLCGYVRSGEEKIVGSHIHDFSHGFLREFGDTASPWAWYTSGLIAGWDAPELPVTRYSLMGSANDKEWTEDELVARGMLQDSCRLSLRAKRLGVQHGIEARQQVKAAGLRVWYDEDDKEFVVADEDEDDGGDEDGPWFTW